MTNGQLVITDFQEKGRGQRGNSWESEKGKNLLFSLITEAGFLDASEGFQLNVVTSLAIADALKDYVSDGIAIKWPNDIYYDNRKLAGILVENTIKNNGISHAIIGLGLNVNQEEFSTPNAVSLKQICNQEIDRLDLLDLILGKFEARYLQLKRGSQSTLIKNYLAHMYWRNEIHVFRGKDGFFNGTILGIDKVGKLHVELEDGEQCFNFKEIEFIR